MYEYVQRHLGTYRSHLAVPKDLRPFILSSTGQPRSAWVLSLHTADLSEAKQQRPANRRQVCSFLRQRMMLSTAEISEEDAAARDLVREKERDLAAAQQQIDSLEARVLNLGWGVRPRRFV